MIDLNGNPFFLDDEAIAWVNETRDSLTDDEKIGQLFVLESISGDPVDMRPYFDKIQPGGLMFRPNVAASIAESSRLLQSWSTIPMLLAANLCHSVADVAFDAPAYATAYGVGAAANPKFAARQGTICGRGGRAMGINWTFAPICDLNRNYMSSVINTRAYGDDPNKVAELCEAFITASQDEGVAACFKHFPGDGLDFRDQHLTLTVNDLDTDEWDQSFGSVYRRMIDAGALTCMSGHIIQPAYSMKLNPALTYGQCLPASLSKELLTDLLRGQLGFNGLIVTDAAQMAGMALQLPRAEAVPLAIEAGNDMFLFYRDFDEDFDYMRDGLASGALSRQRLDDAVTRILATKAALGLHRPAASTPDTTPELSELNSAETLQWAAEVAEAAISLVKDLQPGLFPITPDRYPKLLVYSHVTERYDFPVMRPEFEKMIARDNQELFRYFVEQLKLEGFEVTVYDAQLGTELGIDAYHSGAAIKAFDLAVHFANVSDEHGRAPRVLFQGHCANDAPAFGMYIPTVFISMTSPYLLPDIPRVKTYINAYTPSAHTVDALMNKLTGRTDFTGVDPTDPFCGLQDTRY